MARQARPGQVTPQMAFQARMSTQGGRNRTVQDMFAIAGTDEDRARRQAGDVAIIEHESSTLVKMWKPIGNGDYMPRPVPITNIAMLFSEGWLEQCPHCHTSECTDEPNSCTGRVAKAYRICPECQKKVYDFQNMNVAPGVDTDDDGEEIEVDPNAIVDDAYAESTPGARTKSRLDRHMTSFHPEEAAARGIFSRTATGPDRTVTLAQN